MPFHVHAAGDEFVITLTAQSLRDPTAEAVGESLLRLADEPGRHRLRLDLGAVPYLTSEWLGKFVALHKAVRSRGGRLTVVNVPARVYEVFQVTRLDRVLDVRPAGAG
jgi:anti-sigma B factor antagonist